MTILVNESFQPNCQSCQQPMQLYAEQDGIRCHRCPNCFGNPHQPNMVVECKLHHENARLPTYAKPGDAGADLYAALFSRPAFLEVFNEYRPVTPIGVEGVRWNGPITLEPGRCVLVHTEVSMAIPLGWEGEIRGRSGLAFKNGVTMFHNGTIDAGYRGTIDVLLRNESGQPCKINIGERIAQIVFKQVGRAFFPKVEELPPSIRSTDGFGSSGK